MNQAEQACISMSSAMAMFFMSEDEREITQSRKPNNAKYRILAENMNTLFDMEREEDERGPLTEEDHRANAGCHAYHLARDNGELD